MNLREIAEAALSEVLSADAIAEDASLPSAETLAEHRKHCRAKPGNCPFEKRGDLADDLAGRPVLSPAKLFFLYKSEGVIDRLVSEARRYTEAVADGMATPRRLPAEVFMTEMEKPIPEWLVSAYHVASAPGVDNRTAYAIVRDFATVADCLFPDASGACEKEYGKRFASGMEASVYNAGDNVVKTSGLGLASTDILQKIERILLSNIFFPETAYEVIGFGGEKGVLDVDGATFVLAQPRVSLSEELLADEEIEAFLKSKGFKAKDMFWHSFVSEDNNLAAMDMHGENVVKTKDGKIVVIDPCVIPNVYDLELRGFYNYDEPPTSVLPNGTDVKGA